MPIETGSVVDLQYVAEHVRTLYRVKIVDLDDKGMMIFSPATNETQWFPYTSIVRMIVRD
jgi:hypothetical protein